ncbi:MAG: ATP-dependent DNA ligase [Acidimicrobiia bacterium]|nr:ATP-dependent DNA ligase [Acidimicrobiia bacterium]
MLLRTLVQVSGEVAATAARNQKIALLADAVESLAENELEIGVSYLAGVVPQGSFGVGFAAMRDLPDPAPSHTLKLVEVDEILTRAAAISGEGSVAARRRIIDGLFARGTSEEQGFLTALLLGGLRQGASERLMMDAVAKAFGVPATLVRRATMFSGDVSEVATAARNGGREAVAGFRLQLFRPVLPMLAKTAADVGAALDKLGEAAVERKLDGARIQVHRSGNEVRVYTRNLNDITERVPEVVEAVRAFDVRSAVLDGEALGVRQDGRPMMFQATMSRFGSEEERTVALTPFFFDVLHLDGDDVLDLPASDRLVILDRIVPPALRVPRIVTADREVAASFFIETLAAGHEGVVMKALAAPYAAGRRGAAWLKVKPAHTLDLVVLAVEWGSGRRQGWLSNIHLGARAADGGFVMLGKTFKGMTDEMLEWQTKRFLELETHREGHVVRVRPEQVVEVAFDGIQASSRYPGGMALRFARVKGYRHDKPAEEADTIETVRAIFEAKSG